MLRNDRAEIASVFVSERPPGEYQQSANGPNFYFSHHFLMLPPPSGSVPGSVRPIIQPKGDRSAVLALLEALSCASVLLHAIATKNP